MKHIFTIHSPLTFLVAYSVIEHLNLNRKDVILISSNYKVPVDQFQIVTSFVERYEQNTLQKLRYLNVPLHFDRYINELTDGEAFTAYVDLMSRQQRMLITHEKCVQFHFIEEGNSTYMAYDDLNDLTWEGLFRGVTFREKGFLKKSLYQSLIRVLRGFNYRLLQIPYHYMAYTNFRDLRFFCFSRNAFYNAPENKKTYVKPKNDDFLVKKLSQDIQLVGETIWVDGSNARFTGLPESYYHKAIDLALAILKEKTGSANKLFLKLRPGTKEEVIKNNYLVKAARESGFKYEVLPSDINLECLFINSHNCKVIGVLTSALEYAHTFGHEAFTIYNLFEERPTTFFDRMEGFWKHIKPLT